jgi:endonuclease/exonuclease/phosphatase family metal-dependent hydrolase
VNDAAPTAAPLRLVSYNIRFGGRGREGLIGDVLAGLAPDLVVLEEATDPRVVETIGRRLGMREAFAQPNRSVAALSAVPVASPSWRTYRRGRAVLELPLPAHGLRVLGVHLSAGMSWRGERVRISEAGHLLEGIEGAAPPGLGANTPGPALAAAAISDAASRGDARADGSPAGARPIETGPREAPARTEAGDLARPPSGMLILGDFNSVAPGDAPVIARMPWWVRLLLRFDGGIHTRVIQMFLDAGFVDAYRRLHPHDLGFTLPTVNPSVRLDYAMAAPDVVSRLVACGPVEPDGLLSPLVRASDHLPLLTELAPPDGFEPPTPALGRPRSIH